MKFFIIRMLSTSPEGIIVRVEKQKLHQSGYLWTEPILEVMNAMEIGKK